jgi:adenosylhomocysteinase
MDMSFVLQALSARYVAEHHDALEPKVIRVPDSIDYEVARYKLEAMGMRIDELTEEQQAYLEAADK